MEKDGNNTSGEGLLGTITGNNECVITPIKQRQYIQNGNISRIVNTNGIFKVEVKDTSTITYSYVTNNDNNNAQVANIYALKIK